MFCSNAITISSYIKPRIKRPPITVSIKVEIANDNNTFLHRPFCPTFSAETYKSFSIVFCFCCFGKKCFFESIRYAHGVFTILEFAKLCSTAVCIGINFQSNCLPTLQVFFLYQSSTLCLLYKQRRTFLCTFF